MNNDGLFEQGNHALAAGGWSDAIAAFSLLLSQNPDDWQARSNRALAYYRLGAYDKALDDYCLVLEPSQQAPNVLVNFAALLKELGQLELAETFLLQALQAEPGHAEAWSNLGLVRQYQLRYPEAVECCMQAIKRGGGSAARYTNLGNALTGQLALGQAVAAYQQALALDASFQEARYNQSIPLFMLGQYLEAWPLYEARWQTILTPRFKQRRWLGQPLGTSTLLIWSEQGLGDSLQMARFIPRVQQQHPDARIVLSCPISLHRLFAQFSGVTLVDTDSAPEHDLQLPMASLPGVFQLPLAAIPQQPYLRTEPGLQAHWQARLGARTPGRLRVGLVWQSGVWGVGARDFTRQHKSIDPALLAPLWPLADFIALQPESLPTAMAPHVQTLEIKDFADSAAIMSQLDLLISVDTAAAHLAGAMGLPVWVLMRHEGAPFFGVAGAQAPWYASATVLRQPEPGAWAPVITEVAHRLRQWPQESAHG